MAISFVHLPEPETRIGVSPLNSSRVSIVTVETYIKYMDELYGTTEGRSK